MQKHSPQDPQTQQKQAIKQGIRKSLRLKRQTLPQHFIRQQGLSALRQLISHPIYQSSRHIGVYWPVQGELDPRFIIQAAWRNHKKCYLPVLHPFKPKRLFFAEYQARDKLIPNRYHILEPNLALRKPISPWYLDLVLVPVVAFDESGHRIGRGAGYYDQTFDYLQSTTHLHRPKLIGLAYEFQKVEAIPKTAWDIPLAGIVTEKRCLIF